MKIQTVVRNQAVKLHYGHHQRQVVQTRWIYSTDDQFAITVRFRVPGDWVEWRFARDLLAEGIVGEAGIGDVRVRFTEDDELLLELCSPNGVAVFDLDVKAANQFLEATCDLVPLDEETEDLSVLDELLSPSAPGPDSAPPAP